MKPKCPKCGKSLDNLKNAWGRTDGAWTVACSCGWSRRISRAAIIRLATQGKPETCKWTARRSAFNPLTNYKTGCGGYAHGRMGNYCSGCGKPVEVVNEA